MYRSRHILALMLLGLSPAIPAHQDAILSVATDSSIVGLPSKFGRVMLSIRGLESEAPTVEFGAGGNLTSLQPCATKLIRSRSMTGVSVSGSWYHDEKTLPYYVQVLFHDHPSPDHNPRSGYSFVFNMRNAELISAHQVQHEGSMFKQTAIDSKCKLARTMRSNTSLERTREG